MVVMNAATSSVTEKSLYIVRPQTRDIVQDVYIRKVERVGGKLYNVEFDAQKAVKDPGKK